MLKDTFLAKGVESEKKVTKKMSASKIQIGDKMNRSTAERMHTPMDG